MKPFYNGFTELWSQWAFDDLFAVTVGQQKHRFTHDRNVSSRYLNTVERSMLLNMFNADYTPAVTASGISDAFAYYTGIFSNATGPDVSKSTLDVYRPDSNEVFQIENSDVAIAELCSHLEKKKRKVMVVMEGSGGYEDLLLTQLANHKLDAAVINPRRIRDFAKGIGLDAKTDAIDAKVISKYAEVVRPQPMATKSDHKLKHGALVARRNQLLELMNQENNRLKQAWDKDAKQSIQDVLEMLKKQLKDVDSKLARMLQIDSKNQRVIEVLGSVKGVGPVSV